MMLRSTGSGTKHSDKYQGCLESAQSIVAPPFPTLAKGKLDAKYRQSKNQIYRVAFMVLLQSDLTKTAISREVARR
jgi:hypothetical protein